MTELEPDGSHQRSGGPFADKRLIIFDCDGVLVDSEMIATAVLVDHLHDLGVPATIPEIAARVIGRSAPTVQAVLMRSYGVRIDAMAEKRLQERLFARFREELKPVEGIRQLLDRLTVPYCLASSSSPKRIQVTLAAAGLADRFSGRIFSASMVARGKPAPDLFLHVARTMGVEPRDCLVIEDSPAGIEAAKQAGIAVIGFVGGSHAQGEAFRADLTGLEPDAICTTAEEVLALIA
ncbi:MAG: HAD family hydrolase [Ancalomicrobiaceae bacterium]|nr:HAD family hydrolase [Ancalomicrobiaceae bacterium]